MAGIKVSSIAINFILPDGDVVERGAMHVPRIGDLVTVDGWEETAVKEVHWNFDRDHVWVVLKTT